MTPEEIREKILSLPLMHPERLRLKRELFWQTYGGKRYVTPRDQGLAPGVDSTIDSEPQFCASCGAYWRCGCTVDPDAAPAETTPEVASQSEETAFQNFSAEYDGTPLQGFRWAVKVDPATLDKRDYSVYYTHTPPKEPTP